MENLTNKSFQIQSEETTRLRITLLGGFQVWVGSHLIPEEAWKRRKVQALVKLLALASRHRLHREQIMNHLWPDAETEAARNSLRQTLHLARQILKSKNNSGSEILIDHNGYAAYQKMRRPVKLPCLSTMENYYLRIAMKIGWQLEGKRCKIFISVYCLNWEKSLR